MHTLKIKKHNSKYVIPKKINILTLESNIKIPDDIKDELINYNLSFLKTKYATNELVKRDSYLILKFLSQGINKNKLFFYKMMFIILMI